MSDGVSVSVPAAWTLLFVCMSTDPKIPKLGDRVRVTGIQPERNVGVAGTVTALEPDVHYDRSPAVVVTLVNGERVWGHANRFTTAPLPSESTWGDYVTANGGPEASGWWVTLRWLSEDAGPSPEVVGPYPSHDAAVAAMENSLLIDSIIEDPGGAWLDDLYVSAEPATIARVRVDHADRVTLIDPTEPAHFATAEPPQSAPDQTAKHRDGCPGPPGHSGPTLQAGAIRALDATSPRPCPPVTGATDAAALRP